MGFRIFIGVVVGVSFRILQDMLGPLSVVFEFPPLMAVLAPVLFCVVVGLYLLRRSG
jgi:lipopolysaccharide export system permease protein